MNRHSQRVALSTVAILAGLSLAFVAPASDAASATVHPTSGRARAALPPSLAMFADCPVRNTHVTTCLASSTTSTTFTIGSTTVRSTKAATISLGVYPLASGRIVVVLPDDGKPALRSPAIPLPGGITGLPGLGSGPLQVTVQPRLVGRPSLDLVALLTRRGPGFTLPLDILISTPTGVLGADCTIGDAAHPVRLRLTTGTTSPPGPNRPIHGTTGKISTGPHGVTVFTGMRLVDNSFASPGTYGCGPAGLFDPILNLDKGLPSPAGSNTAILVGRSYVVAASVVRKYLG